MSTLIALILPAVLLPALLVAAGERPELPRLFALSTWPVELWVLAISGAIATVAGVLDWSFHRHGGRRVPRAEHRAELPVGHRGEVPAGYHGELPLGTADTSRFM